MWILSAFFVLASLPTAAATGPKIVPSPPGDEGSIRQAASELEARMVVLEATLEKMRDTQDPLAQQAKMQEHWQAMQNYMAVTLKLMQQPMPLRPGEPDCRVVGSHWPGLGFPRQVSSAYYHARMRLHVDAMRGDIGRLAGMTNPAEFQAALRTHWDHNYRVMQEMRGMGWMFEDWMPVTKQGGTPPEPTSEGARLVELYCTPCHARPSPVMHTADEWDRLMQAMVSHMELSDGGPPMCVRIASDAERKQIGDYLRRHAR
jgi:hypothetical protein